MLSLRASSKQTFSFSEKSLYTFLFYIHQFHVSSSFCFFCLARCSFRPTSAEMPFEVYIVMKPYLMGFSTTFWSKECVMTGIEGLMSSGSVTDVTGTLFRTRNTFCWTAVRMNIWSDFAHSNSLSSHLSLRMAQLV